MQINPKTLRYILAIAEEKSFSRAAEKLFISQPSLSQHIRNAEKEMGVQFFNRTVIPITLTYAGERLVTAARDFLQLEDRLTRELNDIIDSQSGRLIIGTTLTRGTYIIPHLFPAFKQEYPNVELVIREGTNDYLIDLVLKGNIDFAFVGESHPDLVSVVMRDDRLLLAAPIGCAAAQTYIAKGKRTVDLCDFAQEPFILLHTEQALRINSNKIPTDYGLDPLVAYKTRSFETAFRMAEAGLGCTFVISSKHRASERIAFFDFDRGVYSYPLLLVYRKNMYLSKAMKRFLDLTDQLKKNWDAHTAED